MGIGNKLHSSLSEGDGVIDSLKESENIVVINADGTVDEVAAQIEKAVMSLY